MNGAFSDGSSEQSRRAVNPGGGGARQEVHFLQTRTKHNTPERRARVSDTRAARGPQPRGIQGRVLPAAQAQTARVGVAFPRLPSRDIVKCINV